MSNSIHDGSSSIVAQLAAAQQAQQLQYSSTSNTMSSNSSSTRLQNQPQIHAAKLALATSSVIPSNSNLSNTTVMANQSNIVTNGHIAVTPNGNHIENQMLLRDYVNLPPPPPYPGTSSNSSVAAVSSVSNTAPKHGHSTSNVSVGSNGT